ncbi:MAG: hypothetical protein KME64_04695 [Scytonematopsis contorta HA4267-MV1]|jgi:hypothetical protein|nr:hypothetical protein [Scytonematopsis contorta HA4267-MV1]
MNSGIVLLDSGLLGWVIHSKSQKPDVIRCHKWLRTISNNYKVFIPEITDYEVRRELIHQKLGDSLKRLDDLENVRGIGYLPITTEIMSS